MTKNLGLALLVVAVWGASVVAYPARAQFPFPISLRATRRPFRLLGSYRGGVFSTASAQGPAAYDPRRHRLL